TERKKLHIHLSHERYKNLEQNESFVNDMENGLLLLRKTEDALLAFDNCCPHLGSRNQWTFSNNKFRCNNHGNTFGTSEGFTSYCSSNSRSGNLRQFPVVVFKDLATVDFS
ncbi:MAG: Rieske 2Fe-2S domain-containing protein, partial [Flavobacteriaceae bacterium]